MKLEFVFIYTNTVETVCVSDEGGEGLDVSYWILCTSNPEFPV